MKTISSLQHPIIKHFTRLRQNRDYRYEHRIVPLEGLKLIQDIASTHQLKVIIAVDESLLPPKVRADEVLIVTPQIMQKLTGVQNPEGLLAEIQMPERAPLKNISSLLVLEEINDPGNLGTLLRTALALGWEGAFLIEPICDPYNDKVLRSSKGAVFHLPFSMGTWKELEVLIKENSLSLLGADTKGEDINTFPEIDKVALLLGNEAHGLSEYALSHCRQVTIPMNKNIESLNVAVAGGIAMYLLQRKTVRHG